MADDPFEIKFNSVDWATYKFKLVKDGVQGLDEMQPSRPDLMWVPGKDEPYYFGSVLGEKHISVTGVVIGDDRDDLTDQLDLIKANLTASLTEAKQLLFGDSVSYYTAVFDGTFTVRFIGSALVGNAALLTAGFIMITDRWLPS